MISVNPLEVVKGDPCGALKSSSGLWSDSGPVYTAQHSISGTSLLLQFSLLFS